MSGTALSEPFTISADEHQISASSGGIPDSASVKLRGGTPDPKLIGRTERYMSSKAVFSLIGFTFLMMCVLYVYL